MVHAGPCAFCSANDQAHRRPDRESPTMSEEPNTQASADAVTAKAEGRSVKRLVRRWYVTTNKGMAGKGANGENPPWLGRCWGFWLPRLRWNGGKPWQGQCCDITAKWLCFWWGFTIWPHARPTPNAELTDRRANQP